MRTTCEIVADLKEGKDATYEELKMACLTLNACAYLFKRDIAALIKGGIAADLKVTSEYSDPETSSKEYGIPSWYYKAVNKDPMEWLSPGNMPGTAEYEARYKASKAIFDKAMKGNDKLQGKGWSKR